MGYGKYRTKDGRVGTGVTKTWSQIEIDFGTYTQWFDYSEVKQVTNT